MGAGVPGTWACFDYPLHAAGDFDSITNSWMHLVLTVNERSVFTYVDGIKTGDSQYGSYPSAARKWRNGAQSPMLFAHVTASWHF